MVLGLWMVRMFLWISGVWKVGLVIVMLCG